MGLLYARAGRLTAKHGGFRLPGQLLCTGPVLRLSADVAAGGSVGVPPSRFRPPGNRSWGRRNIH
jgi:hypothetical protein